METWLKAKTAGLPRWAWVALLGGGVVLGLYLRSRHAAGEVEAAETGEPTGEGELVEGGYGGYGEGGLAGAGLIGPAGSTSVPVQTPYIPEGLMSSFEALATQLGEQSKYIIEHPPTQTVIESSGGGPPEAGYHEALPTPSTPSPKAPASCSQGDINTLRHNKQEIERLQGEIQQLQNNISQHPKAGQVGAWRSEIDSKRQKVNALSQQNQQIRNKPGCGNVQV